jgi:hypothetical protein
MVTGRKPYEADTPMAVMLKQVNDPLPHPRQFVPGLPEGLEIVLLKALEKQPENRYRSMSEFAAELEKLTSGQTLGAMNNAQAALAGQTMLASAEPGQESGISPRLTGSKSEPVIGSTPGSNNSPGKLPQPALKKSRRWIPVVIMVVLLCLAAVIAGGLSIRSLASSSLLAGLIKNPATSTKTFSPTRPLTQSSTNPLVLVPTTSLSVPLPTPGTQVKVLWDVSHGPWTSTDGTSFTPDGMYKSLAQALSSENIVISSGDLTNLNSYDILVISAPSMKMPFTNSEVDKIEQFVRGSGHGLLVMSDTPEFENLSDIVTRRFFIRLGELTSAGPVSNSNEPFFSGINSVQFINGGGIFQVSSPSQTASVDKNGNSVIAFCNCDTGRVMAVSDANLWDNTGIIEADNQRFALNVFLWLAKLSP